MSASPTSVPGVGHLGTAVAAADERIDALLERVRGNAVTDAVFTTASHVGDFSLVWHAVGVARALAGGRRERRQALALSALLGAESLLVNQGLKRLFRRQRPTASGDERFTVRTPSTTSFPSGHASSAAFAATVLSTWSPRRAPLFAAVAVIVGTSRAYVRIHHASDVAGGAVVGLCLGALARPLVKRLAAERE